MANTYTQISIQIVFAVKGRENLIASEWRDSLHRYIAGIVKEYATPLAVGGWKDHVHVFVGLPPTISVAEFVQKVKANSSRWINEQHFVKGKFQWQQGYGAFSYSKAQLEAVVNYVVDQERHHGLKTFQQEYTEILADFDIALDRQYLFEFYD